MSTQETDAQPMPRDWVVERSGNSWIVKEYHTDSTGRYIYDGRGHKARRDARLIAAAGTAAQKAKEMGYDPQKAVEALPDLLEALEWTEEMSGHPHAPGHAARMKKVKGALASAGPSDD